MAENHDRRPLAPPALSAPDMNVAGRHPSDLSGRAAAVARNGPISFVVLTVLIMALATLEIAGKRAQGQAGASFLVPSGGAETFTVPPQLHLSSANQLLAGSDAATGSLTLWSLRHGAHGLAIGSAVLSLGARRLRVASRFSVPLRVDATDVEVGRWNGASAVFELRQLPRGVEITVTEALAHPRILVRAFAPVPPRFSNAVRSFAIATWSGGRPDLFVIDNLLPSGKVFVRVYSGESAFRRSILNVKTPRFGGRLVFNVVQAGSGRLELVGITRGRTQSGRIEAHVLSGDSGFRRFALHMPLPFPQGQARTAALGVFPGGVVYLFDPKRPNRLRLFALPIP